MYKYLKTWPSDRENGWSEELNGICHDANNWFFTQNGNLWKFPITHRLNDKVTGENKEKGILKNRYGKHLGDCDCHKEYLFVPVTGDGNPYIAVFSAKNLAFMTRQRIKRNNNYFSSLGWCAVNPNDGLLYTSDRHVQDEYYKESASPIVIYDIDFEAIKKKSTRFLRFRATLILRNEKGAALTLEHMQGGCFDNENHLHINNGYYSGYANSKGGISVFSVPKVIEINSSTCVTRIAKSGQKGTFRYQFNSWGEEPEGITYWDLNKDTRAPEIRGVLHAIMIDNVGVGDDDFYFKHYDRI